MPNEHGPNKQRSSVLVVEDEADIATLILYNLDRAGFDVTTAMDGEEALLITREQRFDLILLDWMLPLVSGIEICRQLRQRPDTKGVPIIMLTARGEENARIQGLNAGADDYVTKPFSPKELIARIHAVLRRANPTLSEDVLTYLDITMDTGTQRVTRNGTAIDLRPAEFKLLHHFMGQPGRVFSREQLLDALWHDEGEIEARTVDVHIRRLRKALSMDGAAPDVIRTVRSSGYALDHPHA